MVGITCWDARTANRYMHAALYYTHYYKPNTPKNQNICIHTYVTPIATLFKTKKKKQIPAVARLIITTRDSVLTFEQLEPLQILDFLGLIGA